MPGKMMQWGRETAPIVLSIAGAVAGLAAAVALVVAVVAWMG